MKRWNETTRMIVAWVSLGAMIGIIFIMAAHFFIKFAIVI